MTLQELIALYRAQSMDQADPPFCADPLLAIYASEAQVEACRRGKLIRDSSSSACAIAFKAGDIAVKLHPKVVRIVSARLGGMIIHGRTVEEMDCLYPGWMDDGRTGMPQVLVTDASAGKLHLYPIPDAIGTIRLTVERLPLAGLRNGDDEPEIRAELHAGLVDWMLFRAYSREDTDLHNDAKAAVALQRFEAEFGRKSSGRNEQWVRDGGGEMPAPIA